MPDLIVVFGAKVSKNGIPSRALRRRVDGAIAAAKAAPDAVLLCSGAATNGAPSEASIMARLLMRAGVPQNRIVLDEASRDTLQTVVAACAYMRANNLEQCLVCTDLYHQPRAIALFHALGFAGKHCPVRSARRDAGVLSWLRMSVRELIATPYDLALVWTKRAEYRRTIESAPS